MSVTHLLRRGWSRAARARAVVLRARRIRAIAAREGIEFEEASDALSHLCERLYLDSVLAVVEEYGLEGASELATSTSQSLAGMVMLDGGEDG